MHELSIALKILDIAAEQSERHGGGEVVAVHVRLGALSGVVRDALLSAFELARECSPFPAVDLVIEDTPVIVYCPACAVESRVESIQRMCCARCGTATAQIRSGRELEVTALEISESKTCHKGRSAAKRGLT